MRFSTAFAAVLLAGAAPSGATVTIEPKPQVIESATVPEPDRGWLALVIPGLVIGLFLIGRGKPRSPQSVTA